MTKSKVSTPHLPFWYIRERSERPNCKNFHFEIGYFCNFLDYFERSDITPSPSKGRFSNTPFVDERLSIEI